MNTYYNYVHLVRVDDFFLFTFCIYGTNTTESQFLECKLKTWHFLGAFGSLLQIESESQLVIKILFYLLKYLVSNCFSMALILTYPHGAVDLAPLSNISRSAPVELRKCWRMSCDVGEVKERLENERCWFVGEARKGWRMSCDVGKATEGLENELWHRSSNGRVGEWAVT